MDYFEYLRTRERCRVILITLMLLLVLIISVGALYVKKEDDKLKRMEKLYKIGHITTCISTNEKGAAESAVFF